MLQDYESKLEALQKQVDRCHPDAPEEEEEPEEEGSDALKPSGSGWRYTTTL